MNISLASAAARQGRTLAWQLALVILLASPAGHAQDTPATELVAKCSECHGIDGIGVNAYTPHLNGQPEELLNAMLDNFKQGKRPSKARIHREITAAEAALLARHYSRQQAERSKPATNPELVARGEELYLKRCANCHLDNGRESDKEAPLTAAQQLNYLIVQTLAFKTGERPLPYLMDRAYRGLGDEELTAIAHFFAAQDQISTQQKRRRRR